jgi:tripartite-type tricarboxylate transporter receptor subunit TctC
MKSPVRLLTLMALSAIVALTLAACGSDDPTPTSAPSATATPVPTATLAPGVPTPTPAPATPTPAPTPTPAFDGDAYFAGQTIKMITGTSPGGGYDTMLRIFGKIAPNHFPEGTRFVVQNIPGAAQKRGLLAVLNSEPDGFTMGPTHQRWFIQQGIYGDVEGLDFEALEVIGSPTFQLNPSLACGERSAAATWADAVANGVQYKTGQTGPGNQPGVEYIEHLGGPIENIYGYGGSAEVMAAFDRGEINAIWGCDTGLAGRLYPEWIEDQRIVPLFWWGAESSEEWLASMGSTRADVPHVYDAAGITWSDLDKQAFSAWETISLISRTFLLPPGVSPEVADYWREKFKDVVLDPEFVAAVDVAGYTEAYGYANGVDIKESLLAMSTLPANIKDVLKNFAPAQE